MKTLKTRGAPPPIHDTHSIDIGIARSLTDSAQEFVESAVEYAKSGSKHELKYAVLHVVAGIELAVKARLSLEHWSLVFEQLDKASLDRLYSGEFRSVGIEDAVERMENLARVQISDAAKRELGSLRNMRNRIAHFNSPPTTESLRAALAIGLGVFMEVYADHLVTSSVGKDSFVTSLARDLRHFEEFVSARMASLNPKLLKSKRPGTSYFAECMECLQDAAVVTDTGVKCLFCGFEPPVSERARLRSVNRDVRVCKECGKVALIVTYEADGYRDQECIVCGHYDGEPSPFITRVNLDSDRSLAPESRREPLTE